ncbi:MAG: hypothetical protein VXZ99_15815, partial [Pseudomonadota bacterium]|nr:hypothetical protein [Pseudomonadota bacterium]
SLPSRTWNYDRQPWGFGPKDFTPSLSTLSRLERTALPHRGKIRGRNLHSFIEQGYLRRVNDSRAVMIAPKGQKALKEKFGISKIA